MSFGRIVGLVLLFLFFEIVVGASARLVFDKDPLVACGVMTALAGLIWFIYIATTRWLMRPRIPSPMPMPGQMPTPVGGMPVPQPGLDPETAEIANILREADKTLAASPRYATQTHKPRAHELPLYVVLGGEQAGKTSALYNSGVNATLLAGEAQRDLQVVPTRTMNLWFANDALFADFSGRIAGEDNSRWMRALQALRRPPDNKKAWQKAIDLSSPTQNLRGAIVCFDLSLFLGTPDPARITAAARQLNERLRAIGAVFGVSFPVYLLFTKSDKIPYFGEFFGRLSDDEERKVIGCTLPLPEGAAGAGDVYAESENKRLGTALDRLITSLTGKRLSHLARESSLAAKPAIYEHPREWRRFRPELVRFLVEAFRPDVLAATPQLRGFYFSGVRQVLANTNPNPGQTMAFDPGKTAVVGGTQIFQVGMTQVFGGPTPPAAIKPPASRSSVSRHAFLGQLFNDIVLADHAAVPLAPVDARQSMTQRMIFGAAAAVGAIACICFLGSWVNNWSMLRDARPAAELAEQRIPRGTPALDASRLQALDALRRKIELLREHDKPLFYRFGLWSGDRALDALRAEYFGLFKEPFYKPMVESLEKLFAYGQRDDVSNRIYSYRAITSGGCAPNENILGSALPPVWQASAQSRPDAETAALAEKQIRFYARELALANPYPARKEDAAALEKARSFLKGTGEDVLMALVGDINNKVPAAELAKYAPNYKGLVLAPAKVDGAFTKAGWEAFQQRLIKGDWNAGDSCVMGGVAGSLVADAGFKARLNELYVKRYIEVWKRFLMDSHIDMSGTDAEKARKLQTLGDNRSPLLGLLAMASDNTRAPGGMVSGAVAAAGGVLDDARKILQKAKGESAATNERKADRDLVVQAFQPVHAVISVDDPQKQLVTEANASYVGGLKDYGEALSQMGPNSDPSSVQGVGSARRQAANQVNALAAKFTFVDPAVNDEVKRILNEPLDLGRVLDPYKSDKERINGAAGDACRKLSGLLGRYPFNPRSDNDATLEQFNAVFAPSKLEPLKAALAPFAQTDGRGGVTVSARELKIPKSVLDLYARMIMISNAFYPPGSESPRITYQATISTPSAIEKVTLIVSDKFITATPGKEDSKTFEWSGNPAPVRITVGQDFPFGRFERTWGIFRLMDSADVKQPPRYEFNRMRRPGGVGEPYPDKKGADTVTRLEIRPIGGPDVFAPGFLRLACPVEQVK